MNKSMIHIPISDGTLLSYLHHNYCNQKGEYELTVMDSLGMFLGSLLTGKRQVNNDWAMQLMRGGKHCFTVIMPITKNVLVKNKTFIPEQSVPVFEQFVKKEMLHEFMLYVILQHRSNGASIISLIDEFRDIYDLPETSFASLRRYYYRNVDQYKKTYKLV